MKEPCLHCGDTDRDHGGRGLCTRCYSDRAIRELYPKRKVGFPAGRPAPQEPTEEELEAMIAEQMRNLPAWWNEESRREKRCREEEAEDGELEDGELEDGELE